VRVECADDPEILPRLAAAVEKVCSKYGIPGAYVNIKERPLPHLGLGSATQTIVGAAHVVCRLHGVDRHIRELAQVVGRGGTSGIGVEAIRTGGFIVDGGHRFQRGEHCKHGFMPSAASAGIEPPPVLARHDFPDWDVLVAVPLGEGASGLREVTLFKVICPLPIQEVQKMSHIVLMQMLPAVLEKDLEHFGMAMEAYQKCGFKVFELRAQTQLLWDCLKFLKDSGGVGVGMSSWGPAVYAFGEDLRELQAKTREWLAGHGGGETILTKANNQGMRVLGGA
jgi:beta-ribofuranosylaminobenzene 5'-phosphate synthase